MPLLPVIIHRPLIITIATLGVLGGNVTVHIVTHCLASSSFVYDYMGVNLSSNDPRNHVEVEVGLWGSSQELLWGLPGFP